MSKKLIIICLFVITINTFAQTKSESGATFCNPLNLNYRFQLDEPSRREGAALLLYCFRIAITFSFPNRVDFGNRMI